MDFLLAHMESFAARQPPDSPFKAAINAAWTKLADYYSLTEDTAVYAAATVLHPGQKWLLIEMNWEKQEDINNAKIKVLEIWDEDYKSRSTNINLQYVKNDTNSGIQRTNGFGN
jgi:hypothetical protein